MEKLLKFLEVVEDLIAGICLLILVGVVAFIVLFFGAWIVIGLGIMCGVFLLAWTVGIPITIKEKGVKIGYIRWTKFYPTSNKPWQQ